MRMDIEITILADFIKGSTVMKMIEMITFLIGDKRSQGVVAHLNFGEQIQKIHLQDRKIGETFGVELLGL